MLAEFCCTISSYLKIKQECCGRSSLSLSSLSLSLFSLSLSLSLPERMIHTYIYGCTRSVPSNLTKVRPLFTLSHRGSYTSTLSESRLNDFRHLQNYCIALKIRFLIGRNYDTIYKYKVHTKFT